MGKKPESKKPRPPLFAVSSPPNTPDPAVHRYRAAYEDVLPQAQALRAKDLIIVNIDVPTAVATALGVLPRIRALRAEVVRDLPSFDIQHFDRLESYVLATGHAHALRMTAAAPDLQALPALKDRCLQVGEALYADALALVRRGLIDGSRLTPPKARASCKEVAFDLLALTSLLQSNWDTISSKTAIQPSELSHAEALSNALIANIGHNDQAQTAAAQITEQRQRNFTLFVRAYAQVRRAVAYLRWDQDAERIAPSLYKARIARKGKARRAKVGVVDSAAE